MVLTQHNTSHLKTFGHLQYTIWLFSQYFSNLLNGQCRMRLPPIDSIHEKSVLFC